MSASFSLASFYWNPPKEAFRIPFIDHPIVWYGIFFVIGLILAYFILLQLLKSYLEQEDHCRSIHFPNNVSTLDHLSSFLADRLCWFVVAGLIIGARLGAVFLYDWAYYRQHPSEIFKTWHGGLASHGGVVGIMIGLYLYRVHVKRWVPTLTFLALMDFIAIPSGLTGCFIRIGNFFNQEILGTPTTLPWGVIFGQPSDGSPSIARHPIQLYEAIAYLLIFLFLYFLWKKKPNAIGSGLFSGWLFTILFTSRLILEFWKSTQESIINTPQFQMGQLLSIPFIFLGIYLLIRANREK